MSSVDARMPLVLNGLVVGGGAGGPIRTLPALAAGQIPMGGASGPQGFEHFAFSSYANGASVGAAQTDLCSWTMLANTFSADGCVAAIWALFSTAANANTKTLRFHLGGSSAILNNTTTAPNNVFFLVDVRMWRATSTTASLLGVVFRSTPAVEGLIIAGLSVSVDFTTDMILKFSGQGVANGDVGLGPVYASYYPAET